MDLLEASEILLKHQVQKLSFLLTGQRAKIGYFVSSAQRADYLQGPKIQMSSNFTMLNYIQLV